MVITITGNNGKKNKSVFAAATLAGMNSMTKGNKNLVMQLIDPDIDSVENMYIGTSKARTFVDEGMTFSNEGIDTLLRLVESNKVAKEEFDQMCLALRTENRLDVAEMTRNTNFTMTMPQKMEDIKMLIRFAQDVYDDIFIVLPAKQDELIKEINELPIVERCIYCVRQGYINHSEFYAGEKAMLLVTNYSSESQFSAANMRSLYGVGKKMDICIMPYNINAMDAANLSRLYKFITENRDLSPLDVNYTWSEKVKQSLNVLLHREAETKIDYEWEKIEPWKPDFIYLGDGYHRLLDIEKNEDSGNVMNVSADIENGLAEMSEKDIPEIHSEEEICENEKFVAEQNQISEKPVSKKKSLFGKMKRKKKENEVPTAIDVPQTIEVPMQLDNSTSESNENVDYEDKILEQTDIEESPVNETYDSSTYMVHSFEQDSSEEQYLESEQNLQMSQSEEFTQEPQAVQGDDESYQMELQNDQQRYQDMNQEEYQEEYQEEDPTQLQAQNTEGYESFVEETELYQGDNEFYQNQQPYLASEQYETQNNTEPYQESNDEYQQPYEENYQNQQVQGYEPHEYANDEYEEDEYSNESYQNTNEYESRGYEEQQDMEEQVTDYAQYEEQKPMYTMPQYREDD